jgi:hypothetical protein
MDLVQTESGEDRVLEAGEYGRDIKGSIGSRLRGKDKNKSEKTASGSENKEHKLD